MEVDGRGPGAGPGRPGRAARARQLRRGGDRLGGGDGAAAVDLARRGATAAGAGAGAPVDDRVRQLAAAGRAAHVPAQRAGGRGARGAVDPRLELDAFPAEAIGQSGIGGGAPPSVAKAHHGSMSREQRTLVEEELKSGVLPCVVATSSLELGIDMGAVDLVMQVEAPPAVASGLQRVGRAGHQVGAVSARRGVPEVPGRPRVVRGGGRADGRRARSSRCATRATRSTCWPSTSWPWSRWSRGRSPSWRRWCGGRRRSRRCRSRRCTPCWTCSPGRYPSEEFGELRRGSPGTGSPTSCAAAPGPSGWPSRPAARSRTAACSR